MKPVDLGFNPQKFPDWRQGQKEAIDAVVGSQAFAFLLDAPPGTGKTLIGATIQKLTDQPIVYLASTKQLQAQILGDFPKETSLLMGRQNYPCALHPDDFPLVSANDCPGKCKKADLCAYQRAKFAAVQAPMAVLNYAYFLAESEMAGSFSGRIVVCDECDTLEDQLMSFISIEFTQDQLEDFRLPKPKDKDDFLSWLEWGQEALPVARAEEHSLAIEFESQGEIEELNIPLIRRIKQVEKLRTKLEQFVHDVNRNWVFYPGKTSWEFKPVWVRAYARRYFWQHAERTLCMSGTILSREYFAHTIGLNVEDTEYRAMPCLFPVQNRLIVYRPVANVVYGQVDEQKKLAQGLRDVLQEHPTEKILVHSASYPLRSFLMENLESERLITHERGNREERLETFKNSSRPLVMISPSMDRGVSLDGDLCRVVVIAKVPYPNMSDPQVKRRLASSNGDGQRWYNMKTISTVMQAAMRACRSDTDWCRIYILDQQFKRLYGANRQVFSPWFRDAIRLWKGG